MGELEIRLDIPLGEVSYVRAKHDEWTARLRVAPVVITAGPDPKSTRNKINGALRARGLQALVRRGFYGETEVFVVELK